MITILVVALTTLIASIVGTVTGFGIATTMLPILTIFLPVEQSLLLVSIVHWFNDLWKLLLFKKGIDKTLIIFFGIPSLIMSILGALLIQQIPSFLFQRLLGLFLILYILFLWLNPTFEIAPSRLNASIGGVLSGFSAGFFGIRGAITSSFLVAYDLAKEIYLSTMGAIAIIIDTGRLTTYVASGINLSLALWLGLLIFVPLSFLGAYLGRFFVHFLTRSQMRTIVGSFIVLVGLKLLLGL